MYTCGGLEKLYQSMPESKVSVTFILLLAKKKKKKVKCQKV